MHILLRLAIVSNPTLHPAAQPGKRGVFPFTTITKKMYYCSGLLTFSPRSPTTVEYFSGKFMIVSWIAARRAASYTLTDTQKEN